MGVQSLLLHALLWPGLPATPPKQLLVPAFLQRRKQGPRGGLLKSMRLEVAPEVALQLGTAANQQASFPQQWGTGGPKVPRAGKTSGGT